MTQVTLADSSAIYNLRITSKELINHDVIRFVIELPSKEHILGTRSGQHFFMIGKIHGEDVWRKYTPLDLEDHKGSFEVVIKIYRANQHKDYPAGGLFTQYLEGLQPGDSVSIQGPIGRCVYLHNGISFKSVLIGCSRRIYFNVFR